MFYAQLSGMLALETLWDNWLLIRLTALSSLRINAQPTLRVQPYA